MSENSYSDVDCLFSNGRTPRILVVARAVCEQARKRPARASQRVVRAEARCCQRGAACESATPIVRALTRVPSHYAPTECARGRIGQSGVLAHAKWDGISPSTAHSTTPRRTLLSIPFSYRFSLLLLLLLRGVVLFLLFLSLFLSSTSSSSSSSGRTLSTADAVLPGGGRNGKAPSFEGQL